jgi:hypothetical protein
VTENTCIRRRFLLRGAAGLAPLGPTRPAAAQGATLTFDALYAAWGVRGMILSERVRTLADRRVAMMGYMAPPLRAESRFFVLTREPLSLCPFCQSDAEWPADIVVVYLRRVMPLTDAGARVRVEGRLDIGSWSDPDTGFVSLLRIIDAGYAAG